MITPLSSEPRTEKVSLLVFHCFALPTRQMLSVFQKTGTSVHYLIMRSGRVLSLVPEDRIAYHAGLSSWGNFSEKINRHSIGIEIQSPTMGQRRYTAAQIKSLIALTEGIVRRHKIRPENIVGHADIAPYRKPDPGPAFPWGMLADAGIGLWPEIKAEKKADGLSPTEGEKLLKQIGYNTVDKTAALWAFVTRFMPEKAEKQPDIIRREKEVFDYWLGVPTTEIRTRLVEAPTIYPAGANRLFQDPDVAGRLRQIADSYQNQRS